MKVRYRFVFALSFSHELWSFFAGAQNIAFQVLHQLLLFLSLSGIDCM